MVLLMETYQYRIINDVFFFKEPNVMDESISYPLQFFPLNFTQ